MDSATQAKIWSCLILFSSALLFGLSPLKTRKWILKSKIITKRTSEALLSASICFGAGILMATTFLHILGETRGKFSKLQEEGTLKETAYPIAELVICSGFFLIYLLEEVVHFFVEYHQRPLARQRHRQLEKNPLKENGQGPLSSKWSCEDSSSSEKNGHIVVALKVQTESSESSEAFTSSEERIDHHHTCDEVDSLRSIMIILALSFHGCFEGLALGLAEDEKDVWLLCLALSSHKIFIAFSIGMELLEVGMSKLSYIIQMVVFSLASPLGAIIGAVLSETLGTSPEGLLVIAILDGISGGTILYIVFCEILERERRNLNNRAIKFTALLIGFWVMAGIQTFHDGSHGNFVNATTPMPSSLGT